MLRTGNSVEAQDSEDIDISTDEVAVEAVGAEGRVGVGASLQLNSRGGESASEEGSDSEELHFDGWGGGVFGKEEIGCKRLELIV